MKNLVSYFVLIVGVWGCHPSHRLGHLVEAMETRTLVETKWKLLELMGKSDFESEDQTPFIQFHADGKLIGFGGCNHFTGNYTRNEHHLESKFNVTKMYCEGKMEIEKQLLIIMSQSPDYTIKGDTLSFSQKQKTIIRFIAN